MLRIKKYVRLGSVDYEDEIQYVLDISSLGVKNKYKSCDDAEIRKLRFNAAKKILSDGFAYLTSYVWDDAFEEYRFESSKRVELDEIDYEDEYISLLMKGDLQ